MKKRIYSWLTACLITFCLSVAFGENEPSPQIGLPEGATARLGKGAISKIAYAPDGTKLAVGSSIGVWIYDVESGKALDLFPMNWVSCVAFSPDGKTLVSGSRQHHLVLWDITTGEPLRTFNNVYGSDVFSVAFSPDGKTLVSGHDNGFICLWETATGKASNYFFNIWGEEGTELMPDHIGAIHSIAFSPDGKTLVILCKGTNDAVHLWEATTGKYIRRMFVTGGEENSIESISFSPDGRTVAIGLGRTGISLWDTKTDQPYQFLDGHHKWGVLSLAFSSDGLLLASCGEDQIVNLWDMENNKHLRSFRGYKNEVFSAVFSPDGRTVASSSKESVHLWNTEGEEHLRSVIAHAAILDVTFSPDGKTVASGNGDNTISLLQTKTGKHMSTLTGHKSKVSNVTFSPDGKTLASVGDESIRLWDARTSKHLHTLSESKYRSVAFSPDGETLATKNWDGNVHLWDTKTNEVVYTFTKQKHWVFHMAFSPNGQLLGLLQDEDRNRSLWDIKTNELICSLTVPVTVRNQWRAAFSPDGSMLSTGMVDKTPLGRRADVVWLWDTTTGEHIRTLTGHLSTITGVAFSSDGQLFASGSEDETVLLWDLKTSKPPHILIGHNDDVLGVAFSPDGKTLASRSKDGIVLLWNLDAVIANTEDNTER